MFSSSSRVLSFQIPIFISSPCNRSKDQEFHLDGLCCSQDLLSTWHTKGSHQAHLEQIRTGNCSLSGREGALDSLEWWGGVGDGWDDEAVSAELGCPWVWLERAHQGEESLLSVGLGRNEGTRSLEKFVSDLAAMTGKLQRVIYSRQLKMWNGSLEKFLTDECLESRSKVAGGLFKCYWVQMRGLFVKTIHWENCTSLPVDRE